MRRSRLWEETPASRVAMWALIAVVAVVALNFVIPH